MLQGHIPAESEKTDYFRSSSITKEGSHQKCWSSKMLVILFLLPFPSSIDQYMSDQLWYYPDNF